MHSIVALAPQPLADPVYRCEGRGSSGAGSQPGISLELCRTRAYSLYLAAARTHLQYFVDCAFSLAVGA